MSGSRRPEIGRVGVGRSTLVPALAALMALGCARKEYLVMKVDRADAVALEAVGISPSLIPDYDLAHPLTVLPARGAPGRTLAPYRNGVAQARRNPDGSIELVFVEGTWPLVRADGTVTALRSDAYALPDSGTAWGFLGPPPTPPGGRTPVQLRLVTPRDNISDARLVIRRDRTSGILLVTFAALCAGLGAFSAYEAANADAENARVALLLVGGNALAMSMLAAIQGLHSLLLREHDEVLVHR